MTTTVTQGISPTTQHENPNRLRLLEAWLPLAQAMNSEFGWQLDAAMLERIIFRAAPNLVRITSLADARAVLYYAYAQVQGDTR